MIFEPYKNALLGKQVSHVWRGHGSALFIEFGTLTQRIRLDGSLGNPTGEITLMIEWSWRIERPKSIMGGSWSSERRWPAMFEKLKGTHLSSIKVFGALPEIEVSLSNGLRVVSFMTSGGQPAWAIICRNELRSSLAVHRGKLRVQELASSAVARVQPGLHPGYKMSEEIEE